MKAIHFFFVVLLLTSAAYSQKAEDRLATATGLTFATSSLSGDVQKLYLGQSAALAAERSRLIARSIREAILEAEGKGTGSTAEAIIAAEVGKLSAPSAAEIKSVYDANRTALGERPLDEVRPQIVSFLKTNAEQKAVGNLIEALKAKHKFTAGKDVNAPDLKPTDVLFSVAGRPFTAADLDSRYKAHLYDVKAEIAAYVRSDLENSIFSALIAQEAKSKEQDPADLIAAEVTNKLKDFSDEERTKLENDLKQRLFTKYAVKILFTAPAPVAHDVSVDDDPVFGSPSAPVTVIMFSDFQCSACAATHPVLKKVLSEYGGKARLVVRDFPLESVHENAFTAALAANAAHKQGKFFEYIEKLYNNQGSLDPASLKRYASELGLNLNQFELDFSSENAAAEVRKDMADGRRAGAAATPTIFVNGVKLQLLSADGIRGAIDRSLATSGPR